MWWVAADKKISDGLKNLYVEIERGSDRSVAILAGSIVEAHVTTLLRYSVQADDELWASRTHPSAPLGSFSVKIDLLYMMRRITEEAHRDLTLVKDIRNRFAHDLDIPDFMIQKIKDKCMAMRLVDRYVVQSDAIHYQSQTHINGQPSVFALGSSTALEELKRPRDRYLWACKVFSMALGFYGTIWPPPVL